MPKRFMIVEIMMNATPDNVDKKPLVTMNKNANISRKAPHNA